MARIPIATLDPITGKLAVEDLPDNVLIAITDRGAWASGTQYHTHDLVTYGGTTWLVEIAHVSTSTFDDTKFTELNSYRGVWQANTRYESGDQVVNGGALYAAISTFTSGSSFNPTNWTLLTSGGGAGVISFNSRTGAVTLSKADVTATGLAAGDVAADASGAAAAAQAASDPSGSAAAAQAASLQKSSNLSDVASAPTARTNLGLGSAATHAATDFDTAGAASAAQAAAIAASAQGLTPTAVKTAGYTAAAGDFVPVDISGGAVTVTLPSAPVDKTRIGVKVVKVDGSHANAATVARGGGDVFNVAAGSTTLTLSALFQGVLLQYNATPGIWYVSTADTPIGQANGAASLGTDGKHKSSEIPSSVELVSSVIAGGSLGATYSLAVSGQQETWLVGTLTANLALTVTGLTSGARFRLLLTQDGTGGRTLTINGTSVPVPSAAGAVTVVGGDHDGTNLYITVGGSGSPIGSAGGDLAGTYPNPTVASISAPLIDNLLPWRIPLEVLNVNVSASVGGWTIAYVPHMYGGLLYNGGSPAQNDYLAWDLILAAGTWNLAMLGPIQNNAAIVTAQIDGVSKGTADFYTASAQTYDQIKNISFTVATGGKHRLTLIGATKNASSSGYQLGFQSVNLQRTA